ncbi:DUF2971 domain-containing protein [Thalassotalea profundi]|uniref:DUF2971 domain-containing protein n=1 Tax=Thalassotalea profundi TaxID=2036687 RepID=A0ABQ3IFB8_9GAMM|nr:DUF2971 domain-containing protein [Thalassotalea profundi]GHE78940.1 hypothetical protein GCM10011501_03550 [Thalassotalea profundi]
MLTYIKSFLAITFMLFKYLSPERLDVLQNLKIRFSPLKSLNDPYESLPLINKDKLKQELINGAIGEINELLKCAPQEEITQENLNLANNLKLSLINDIEQTFSHKHLVKGLIEYLGETYGILSLSRSNNSLLMWSHYASSEKGTGYVIGFDKTHEFFHKKSGEGNLTKPSPVIYSELRSPVNNDLNQIESLLCQKPLEWAYEQEERIFRAYMDTERAVGTDNIGLKVITYDIPKEAILAVYIGFQASKELEKSLLKAVIKHDINCDIYKADMSMTEYKIIFNKIKKPAS